ncbi:hypothetical protein LAZ40_09980, partial [Cereibacter sphaeroides]
SYRGSQQDQQSKAERKKANRQDALFLVAGILTSWVAITGAYLSKDHLLDSLDRVFAFMAATFGVAPQELYVALRAGLIVTFVLLALLFKPQIKRVISGFVSALFQTEKAFYVAASNAVERALNGNEDNFDSLDQRIRNLEKSLGAEILPLGNAEDLAKLKGDILARSVSEISAEALNALTLQQESADVRRIEAIALSRLSNQTVVLGSRARLTLGMGVIFCLSGLAALGATFFFDNPLYPKAPTAGADWLSVIQAYIPRLTLVLLIEVIGFFFLKLFSATLAEIRYVQNEITNIEMRLVALYSLRGSRRDEDLSLVIGKLMEIERNSVIDRGQTTVEIERQRVMNAAESHLIESVAMLLHGGKGRSTSKSR